MSRRILFVDDESQILDGFKRNLRKFVDVHVAIGPEAGIKMIKEAPLEFAVVVSDMRMPVMDGAEFLEKVKVLSPNSVRVMLTGNSDQETAIKAVNKGEVFKFLNKPCDPETMKQVLDLGITQYQLVTAERDLLENTLTGCVETLTEILSLLKPIAFGRVKRIRDICKELAKHIPEIKSWELDIAALLSQLGCVNISSDILDKVAHGKTLNKYELSEYQSHPEKGTKLISKIPRLKGVTEIMKYQHKSYDGSGLPFGGLSGDDIPLGARIINAVLEFDDKKSVGWSDSAALEHMFKNSSKFDQRVLDVLSSCVDSLSCSQTSRIEVSELEDGMIVEEDIVTDQDTLLICRGFTLNTVSREYLMKSYKNGVLNKKILVTIPVQTDVA